MRLHSPIRNLPALLALLLGLSGTALSQEQPGNTLVDGRGGDPDCQLEPVHFEVESYLLDDQAKRTLDDNVVRLNACLNESGGKLTKLQVTGHCDNLGRDSFNRKLGWIRALKVKDYLVTKGISKKKIELDTGGEDHPACREQTEECRRLNRRVEMVAICVGASADGTRPDSGTTDTDQPGTESGPGGTETGIVDVVEKPAGRHSDMMFFLSGGGSTFLTSDSRDSVYPPYLFGEIGMKTPGLLAKWLDLTIAIRLGSRSDGTVVLNDRTEHVSTTLVSARIAGMIPFSRGRLYASAGPEIRYQWCTRKLTFSSSSSEQEEHSFGFGAVADAGVSLGRYLRLGASLGLGAVSLKLNDESGLHWYAELLVGLWYQPFAEAAH